MGGAFGAGFSQGFAQQTSAIQQRQQDDELKKLLTEKAKIETDILGIKNEIAKMEPNEAISYITKNPMVAQMIGFDPVKFFKGLLYQGFTGYGEPTPQPKQPNADGNLVEDPNAPAFQQPTFPGHLTGTTMPNVGGINPRMAVEHDIYGRPYTGVRSYEERRIEDSKEVIQQKDAFGNPIGQPVIRPIKGEWRKTNIPGVEQFVDEYGNATGNIRQAGQEYEIKMRVNPDRSETPVYIPKQPGGGMGTPSQALSPGTGQFNLDMTSPTIGDDLIKMGTMIKKKGVGGLPGLGGGLGAPGGALKPPERSMYLKNEDLQKYINVETGERPKGNWTEEMLDASKYIREPEKKLGTEDASKLSNAIMAMENLPKVKERLFPNGQLDTDFAKKLWLWYKSPEAMANSEVAPYGKILKQAGEAQIRLESGANVPESEVKRLQERYNNQLFSSPEAVATGFDMLSNGIGSIVEIADPTGYYRAISKKSRKEIEPQKPTLQMKGNGKVIDEATARKYLNAYGGDKNKAREAAKKDGWKVQ